MAISIHDVASAAGVSATTASQALNGRGRVSPDTREHVLRVAAKLGYRGNALARSLRTGRSRLLGIQIATGEMDAAIANTYYFARLLDGASRAALSRGWLMVVVPWSMSLNVLEDLDITAGLIIDPIGTEPLLGHLARQGGSAVCVGQLLQKAIAPLPSEMCYVDNNLAQVVECGLSHLFGQGYRQPALLTSNEGLSYIDDTVRAYRSYATKIGATEQISIAARGDEKSATKAARRLLTQSGRPDAIYATNEEGVLGVLEAADELNLRIPQDLGIIVALESPLLANLRPSITTIDLFPEGLGQKAAGTLIDFLERGHERLLSSLDMPFQLNPRQSTHRNP